ncbi:ABC transporter substrate binding protein [Desulfohalobium retbaense]|uniref:diguanylate cyclase n=1 Tax=Desulfohalobium retbaense (strain ATCC 49708 / DSM 5692 / JCM 16813 / HR100) TaxID=485915 RepID=C8X3X4_DESRD|nr:ABC transporter substrate binding protein [Desulfohalobium retbaense]ACV69121.1 diguanylate cyclase [Desulfohalobium retbaense DSM 5692]
MSGRCVREHKHGFWCAVFLLMILLVAWTTAEANEKQKILVLHSYHQGLEWTDNITKGVQSVFEPLYNDYELYYFYLDTKRHAGIDYIERWEGLFSQVLDDTPFDIIISSDNNALRFLNDRFAAELEDTPVVFCGVNAYEPGLIANLHQVTGVAEDTDIMGTIKAIQALQPDLERLVFLNDQTVTGRRSEKLVQEVLPRLEPELTVEYHNQFRLRQIPEIVSGLGKDDAIYLLTLNRDADGEFISYADGIRLVYEHASAPIYGSWSFYLGKGLAGGLITRGFDQGRQAALVAKQVLKGAPTGEIPVRRNAAQRYIFDYRVLQGFGLDPADCPPGSMFIHKPPTTWEYIQQNLPFVILVGAVVALLCLSLALALRQRRLMYWASITDSLTGIFNRERLDEDMGLLIHRCHERGEGFACILVDIDYFKTINDTKGHTVGDQVLVEFARLLAQQSRGTDSVFRYGGEEFLMVLPGADLRGASQLAERVRAAIGGTRFAGETRLSASFGVAEYQLSDNWEGLLSRADTALYAAKAQGRNRVVVAPHETE